MKDDGGREIEEGSCYACDSIFGYNNEPFIVEEILEPSANPLINQIGYEIKFVETNKTKLIFDAPSYYKFVKKGISARWIGNWNK